MDLIDVIANFDALHVIVAPQRLDLERVMAVDTMVAPLPAYAHNACDLQPDTRF